MTGSASAHETHLLSDRDIEVFARDVEPLLAVESWWSTLGRVLVVERTENDNGQPTRLIYFTGGKLDFTLIAADELTAATYERPFTVLLDKDDQARSLRCVPPQRSLPDADSFHTCVNEAYAAALMCAKAVVRDELWPAKIRDEDLKWNLLQMIEWDHRPLRHRLRHALSRQADDRMDGRRYPHSVALTALSEFPQSCSSKFLRSRGNASAGLCRW